MISNRLAARQAVMDNWAAQQASIAHNYKAFLPIEATTAVQRLSDTANSAIRDHKTANQGFFPQSTTLADNDPQKGVNPRLGVELKPQSGQPVADPLVAIVQESVEQFINGQEDFHDMVRSMQFATTQAVFDAIDEHQQQDQFAVAAPNSGTPRLLDQLYVKELVPGSRALQQGLDVSSIQSPRYLEASIQPGVLHRLFSV